MGITLITNSAPFSEIGSKTLSSYLTKFKVNTKIIYLNNLLSNQLSQTVTRQILKIIKGDELIGISLMTKDYCLFNGLSKQIKETTGIPVVWGGIHPSVCPEESLCNSDYVCVGEGEEPLLRLYKALKKPINLNKVPNVIYKKGGKVIYPKYFFGVKDLNKLPYPDYEFNKDYLLVNGEIIKLNTLSVKQKEEFLGRTLLFYSQRGCPFSCSYCSNNALKQIAQKASINYCRRTGVDRIIKELTEYTVKYPFIDKIIINDDDFMARSEGEIKTFSDNYSKKIKRPFWINAVPGFVSYSKIKYLTKAGLKQISMGIQTGSMYILKDIYKRYLYPDEIIRSVKIIKNCNSKLRISFDLIVDNPYETDKDIIQTVKLLNNIPKPFDLQIHSLTFFPGTELYKKALSDGFIIDASKQIYNKKYQIDIGNSYLNFVLLLNSLLNIPTNINNILCLEIVRKNIIFKPMQTCLIKGTKILIYLKGIKSLFLNPQLFMHYLNYLKMRPKDKINES